MCIEGRKGEVERERRKQIFCLDWWKARNNERMRALYRSPLPAGAAVGAGGGGSCARIISLMYLSKEMVFDRNLVS